MDTPTARRIIHQVRAAALGQATTLIDGTLTVSATEAAAFFRHDALAGIRLTWVSPGQSARIVKILDAVEPRAKAPADGATFPGFVGPDAPQGRGSTHVLRGAAVVVAGYLPRAQEALADMSGPAAAYSPLGSTHNLVVEFTPATDADWVEVDAALRRGALGLANHLASVAVGTDGDAVETWPEPAAGAGAGVARAAGLPVVGVITNLQTQGHFKDVFVYGRSFSAGPPAFLEPGELDDGAVVSGQFGHPALKNPTILHQNHPVVEALRVRHGVDLLFGGIIVSPEPVEARQKELVSEQAARLGADAGWNAAVVTKEGGGNADGDMALKMDALADLGIAAVGIYAEMSGTDGTGPPVVVPPTKAKAMISSGNYDERVTLPAVDVALGGATIALVDQLATDEVVLPAAVIYGSNNPLGWGRLMAAEGVGAEPGVAALADRPAHAGPLRVVHYVNQFFAGVGGEDSAGSGPARVDGPVGPGRKLAALLGDGFEIVATVHCGDDTAASGAGAIDEVLALITAEAPDVVVAGPAFTSGRYGLACARVAAAASAAGLPVVAAMHPDNPGLDEAGGAPVVASGDAARTMGPSLETLAAAVRSLGSGRTLGPADGRVGKAARRNVLVERSAAERAVDLALAHLGGDTNATEVPLPRFDRVTPAPAVEDITQTMVALVTEGALVPDANPGGLESARATRWLRYSLDGLDTLDAGQWRSVHGGFSTQWANADPHRILPLDVARDLEREGRVGSLHTEYLVTAGNGTSVANARRFGVEWAADLRRSGARAAILTAT